MNTKERKKLIAKLQRGATMIEYAIMVAVFSVAMIGAITLMREEIKEGFDTVTEEIKKANETNSGS